jgi:hypothetical protein
MCQMREVIRAGIVVMASGHFIAACMTVGVAPRHPYNVVSSWLKRGAACTPVH